MKAYSSDEYATLVRKQKLGLFNSTEGRRFNNHIKKVKN